MNGKLSVEDIKSLATGEPVWIVSYEYHEEPFCGLKIDQPNKDALFVLCLMDYTGNTAESGEIHFRYSQIGDTWDAYTNKPTNHPTHSGNAGEGEV